MITIRVRPGQTDGQTDRRTGEHRGNSATIRSMDASRAINKSGVLLSGTFLHAHLTFKFGAFYCIVDHLKTTVYFL